jgi:hypothetical protein
MIPTIIASPCDRKYASKLSYGLRLVRTHRMAPRNPAYQRVDMSNPNVVPDKNDPNLFIFF